MIYAGRNLFIIWLMQSKAAAREWREMELRRLHQDTNLAAAEAFSGSMRSLRETRVRVLIEKSAALMAPESPSY